VGVERSVFPNFVTDIVDLFSVRFETPAWDQQFQHASIFGDDEK